jgi:hypothetical protein
MHDAAPDGRGVPVVAAAAAAGGGCWAAARAGCCGCAVEAARQQRAAPAWILRARVRLTVQAQRTRYTAVRTYCGLYGEGRTAGVATLLEVSLGRYRTATGCTATTAVQPVYSCRDTRLLRWSVRGQVFCGETVFW